MTRLDGRTVYLDSNVLIYAVERVAPFVGVAALLVRAVLDGRQQAVTSELTLAECLVGPAKSGDVRAAERFESLLQSRASLAVVPVSRDILREAARLRSVSRLKLPDAIHAATARQLGCDVFLTNDTGIGAVPGVEVVRLAEVVGHG